MAELLAVLLKLSIVIFMAGNLLDMGLRLDLADALKGLRKPIFVIHVVLWGFVLCPALAILLTRVMPLQEPYAMGLILLGMAPCAAFLPKMVDRAHGDLGLTATFMLVASSLLVVYMPFAVPFVIEGLNVSPWAIARPLLAFILLPLVVGVVIHRTSPSLATTVQPIVRVATKLAAGVMIFLCVVIYGGDFIGSAGSFALASLVVFFAVSIVASYWLSIGLDRDQKIVLSVGMATRNLGASLAPLFAFQDVGQPAIVVVVLGLPVQMTASYLAAKTFARRPPAPHESSRGAAAITTDHSRSHRSESD